MAEQCKELEKQAKQNEKDDPNKAIALYKNAAECYSKHNDNKRTRSNFERAANILRKKATSMQDPEVALRIFEKASILYKRINKENEVRKIFSDAQRKFLYVAEQLQAEAKKMDDAAAAEKKFSKASDFFIQGGDDKLSREVWIDSGDQFHKSANEIEDPIRALDLFNHAIQNYRKGGSVKREKKTIRDAVNKFYRKATDIFKSNRDLIMAYYYFTQVINISSQLEDEQKLVPIEEKIAEIRDIMGLPDEVLLNYLRSQGLYPTSIAQEGQKPETLTVSESVEKTISSVLEENVRGPQAGNISEQKTTELSTSKVFEDRKDNQTVNVTLNSDDVQNADLAKMQAEKKIRKRIGVEFLQGSEEGGIEKEVQREEFDLASDVSTLQKKDDLTITEEQEFSPGMILEPISTFKLPMSIVDMLRDHGYIDRDVIMGEELQKVPEYEILSIIIQNQPISLNEIEAKTNISSISMVLSNLTADGMVEQFNDHRYKITQIVEKGLNEQVTRDHSVEDIHGSALKHIPGFEVRVIDALHKYGIISSTEVSSNQLKRITEFEIIHFLKDNSSATLESIKRKVTAIPSVQVNSVLSRLEVDGILSQSEGVWSLSDNFIQELRS